MLSRRLEFSVMLLLASFVGLASAFGQDKSTEKPNPNRIREIGRSEGTPLEVYYADGRVAQVYRKERLDEFKVPVELNENTCKPFKRLSCQMVIPFARTYYVGVWKTHPTREGQPLAVKADPKTLFGNQTFVTRSQNDLFESILRRIPNSAGQSDKIKAVLEDKSMGHIECSEDLTSFIPAAKEIVFWDENYEGGNVELAMSKGFGTRVNQIWRRVQGLPIEVQKNVFKFYRFKKDFGSLTNYYPLGVSYQVQMTFRAPNLVDADDEACMMKWDVNFTYYFTQLVAVLNMAGPGPFDRSEYQHYKTSNENTSRFAQKISEKELWETEGMQ